MPSKEQVTTLTSQHIIASFTCACKHVKCKLHAINFAHRYRKYKRLEFSYFVFIRPVKAKAVGVRIEVQQVGRHRGNHLQPLAIRHKESSHKQPLEALHNRSAESASEFRCHDLVSRNGSGKANNHNPIEVLLTGCFHVAVSRCLNPPLFALAPPQCP